MKTLTKLFLLCAFCAIISMALRNVNAFILFGGLADIFGIWVIVKSFRSNQWGI